MKAYLLLSIIMIGIAIIYLVLSLLMPTSVRINSGLICTALSALFYLVYRIDRP